MVAPLACPPLLRNAINGLRRLREAALALVIPGDAPYRRLRVGPLPAFRRVARPVRVRLLDTKGLVYKQKVGVVLLLVAIRPCLKVAGLLIFA